MRPLAPLSLLLLLPLLVSEARGQGRGDVALEDVLEIVVLEGELLAIDAEGGNQLSEDLHLNERVLWSGSRGRIGAVITNERLLTVSVGAPSWRELRFERTEDRPSRAQLGDRVGVVVTEKRAIGFQTQSGAIFEYRLGPREGVLESRVGSNVVVLVTTRNVVGLSPSGGFAERSLQLKEKLRDLSVRANVATVRTNRRLLIYRGPSRTWAEQKLELRQSG